MNDTLTDNFNLILTSELETIEYALKKKWDKYKYTSLVYIFYNSKEVLEKMPFQVIKTMQYEREGIDRVIPIDEMCVLAEHFKPFLENNDPVGFLQECFRNKPPKQIACIRYNNCSFNEEQNTDKLFEKYPLSRCSSINDSVTFYDIEVESHCQGEIFYLDSQSKEYAEIYWEGLTNNFNRREILKPLKELKRKLLNEVG